MSEQKIIQTRKLGNFFRFKLIYMKTNMIDRDQDNLGITGS